MNATTQPLQIFVDAARGDDAAWGHSEIYPLKTLDEAFRRIPWFVLHPVTINLAAGTYDWSGTLGPRVMAARIYIRGTAFTTLAEGTLSSGSTTSLGATLGQTADQYAGKTLEILSGAAEGNRRHIAVNTTSAFVPTSALKGTPVAGDSFRITEPAVTIRRTATPFPATQAPFPVPAFVCLGSQGARPALRYNRTPGFDVYLINVRLAGSPILSLWDVQSTTLCALGVELTEDTGVFLAMEACGNSLIQAGVDYIADRNVKVLGPFADGLVDDPEHWRGWGLSQVQGVTPVAYGISNFVGYCSIQSITLDGGNWMVFGGSFISSRNGTNTIVARGGARLTLGDYLPNGPHMPVYVKNSSSTDIRVSCVKSQDGATVNLLHSTVEKTNRGFGIQAVAVGDHDTAAPGTISVAGDTGLVNINAVTATNAPDYGMVAAGGGRVHWLDQYLGMTGWAAGTETAVWGMRIDQNAAEVAQDRSSYAADGACIVAADGSTIQRY